MCFGAHGVNINAAAVGHVPENGGNSGSAVMVLTTDGPVPDAVLEEILSVDGFFEGRYVALR
jgi:D-3-phosphoglycerate dehydrogenase / 2-oxoglutarate reductase